MIDADALRSLLSERYQLMTYTLPLAGRKLSLTAVANLDELLDRVGAGDSDRAVPYWATLWPAAVAAAEWLLDQHALVGRSVLELGCGLGLSGIAAALQGASVVLTDHVVDALRFARLNAAELAAPPVCTVAMDYRRPVLGGRYDLVLAADVLYEAQYREPVAALLERFVAPTGQALIADTQRAVAQPFFLQMQRAGWQVGTAQRTITLDGRQIAVDLHQLTRARTTDHFS